MTVHQTLEMTIRQAGCPSAEFAIKSWDNWKNTQRWQILTQVQVRSSGAGRKARASTP